MLPHLDISIEHASDVQRARAAAAHVGKMHHVDETTRGRVALIVTELATNLLRHAQRGRVLIGCHAADDGAQVEVVAIDHGPGISDVNRAVRAGQSETQISRSGLAAVRHHSTDFSLFSVPGRGTVVLARAWGPAKHAPHATSPSKRFLHAGICLCASGQTVSGDGWDILIGEQKVSVIITGGVGWGAAGEDAAKLATSLLRQNQGSPKDLLRVAHLRLQPTTAASIVVAELNARAGVIAIAGVGNIATRLITQSGDGRIYAPSAKESTVDPEYVETRHSWPEHSIVVLHSAGLRDDWTLHDVPGILHCDPAVIAGWLVRDQAIDCADATVVVLKRG